jgi:antitoxin component YwqK of YwqJK toxin-antitoxin module
LDGKTIAYYESGLKKAEGVLNGVSISWTESGQKVSEATFVHGVLQGKAVE